jgi:hypothetical protein
MTLSEPNWNEMFTADQQARIKELRKEGGPHVANLIFREVFDEMSAPGGVEIIKRNGRVHFYDGYMAVLLSKKLASEGL